MQPASVRSSILINANPTVELDYAALQLRMAYHLEGIEYKDDPYEALGYERDVGKKVCLIVIGADNEKDAIKALRYELLGFDIDKTNESIRNLINRFNEVHNPVEKYFLAGRGLNLQCLDSKIAEKILKNFTKQKIPVLPIHDSFIVETNYEDAFREEMINCYREVIGFEPIID